MARTFHIKDGGRRTLYFLVARCAERRIATSKCFDTIYKLGAGPAFVLEPDTSPESVMVERDAEVTSLGSTAMNMRSRFQGCLDDDGGGLLPRGDTTTNLIHERATGQGRANLSGRPCKRGH